MPHDEHVLLLALCEFEPNSVYRRDIYEELLQVREVPAIEATFRDFAGRRGFVTSNDWHTAQLTPAGKDRLAAERAILLTRTP